MQESRAGCVLSLLVLACVSMPLLSIVFKSTTETFQAGDNQTSRIHANRGDYDDFLKARKRGSVNVYKTNGMRIWSDQPRPPRMYTVRIDSQGREVRTYHDRIYESTRHRKGRRTPSTERLPSVCDDRSSISSSTGSYTSRTPSSGTQSSRGSTRSSSTSYTSSSGHPHIFFVNWPEEESRARNVRRKGPGHGTRR